MNGLNEMILDVTGLGELLTKYSDYRKAKASEMPFVAAQNVQEKKLVTKVRLRVLLFLTFFALLLGGLTVLSIIRKDNIIGPLIMGLMCLLALYFLVKNLTTKTTILQATVIHKKFEYRAGGDAKYKNYYVTVIVDEPEKLVCTRINISKKDYDCVEEGTTVYVVNNAGSMKAFPMN